MVHDLPGVGANLHDHYVVRVSHRVKDAVSINQLARGVRLAREVGRFAATGRGALTFGVTSAHGVLPQPRGAGQPGPAIAVHAGELRPARLRRSWSGSRA